VADQKEIGGIPDMASQLPQRPPYGNPRGLLSSHIARQQTTLQPSIAASPVTTLPASPVTTLPASPVTTLPDQPPASPITTKRQKLTRLVVVAITLALALALYFTWHGPPDTASANLTQQNLSASASRTSSSATNASADSGGDIEVYVVGAVKHPGVYTLNADARVYDLLQAAGGPLPNANLVAINLAAKLSDGQEVYITLIGEVPPTYMGGVPGPAGSSGSTAGASTGATGDTGNAASDTTGLPVNINTATVAQLEQALHIRSTTAEEIVNYRLQHGPFTSVDQLAQAVSRSTYDKIKGMVTV
jgi:competence protein ComEA